MPAIRSAQGVASHAYRVVGWDAERGVVLEPWRSGAVSLAERVRRVHAEAARFAVVTDVRECYAASHRTWSAGGSSRSGATATSVALIGRWLHTFRDAGVDGLPVGPVASALLADAVLVRRGSTRIRPHRGRARPLGRRRRRSSRAIVGTRSAALDALRRVVGALGLELHEGKTRLLDDPLDRGTAP